MSLNILLVDPNQHTLTFSLPNLSLSRHACKLFREPLTCSSEPRVPQNSLVSLYYMIEGLTVFEGQYGCAYLEVFQKHWIAAAKEVQQSAERKCNGDSYS